MNKTVIIILIRPWWRLFAKRYTYDLHSIGYWPEDIRIDDRNIERLMKQIATEGFNPLPAGAENAEWIAPSQIARIKIHFTPKEKSEVNVISSIELDNEK